MWPKLTLNELEFIFLFDAYNSDTSVPTPSPLNFTVVSYYPFHAIQMRQLDKRLQELYLLTHVIHLICCSF